MPPRIRSHPFRWGRTSGPAATSWRLVCTASILTMLVLLWVGSGGLSAQEATTGTIEGRVFDDGGEPIPDALLTIVGPQGQQTTVTDAKGRFVHRGLTPGSYTVKAEATGFATVVQSDVSIHVNTRTQLPFVLRRGMVEEVTVVSQAPLVDMKSTTTGQTIRVEDFAPYVPVGRSLTAIVGVAPGVADGGGALGSTNRSISGAGGLENAYFVDGVNVTNSGYGALGAFSQTYGSLGTGVTYEFLDEVQVKTGGFEAEYGQAGGGIVTTVVKSGTNKVGFDLSWYEEPAGLEGSRGTRLDAPNTANWVDSRRRDLALSSGGPLARDRLFYFGAYNPVEWHQRFKLTSGDPSVEYDLDADGTPESFAVGETIVGGRTPPAVTRKRSTDNYAAKLSWFATPNHKLEATAFGDPSDGAVGPQNPTLFLRTLADPAGTPDIETNATGLEWGGHQYSLKYQGVWSPNFFTEALVAHKRSRFEQVGPGTTFRGIFDTQANVSLGGPGYIEAMLDEADQLALKNTHVLGPVELSYGYQYEDIAWSEESHYSGPSYTGLFPNLVETDEGIGFDSRCATGAPDDPACYTQLESATGAFVVFDSVSGTYEVIRGEFTAGADPTKAEERNAYVQASWSIVPSLTLKAGLRWTELELTGFGTLTLPLGRLPSGVVAGGLETSFTAQSYQFESELAPRLGLSWDLRNHGRHKLYANYGEYYQRVPSNLAVRAFSNEFGVLSEFFLDTDLTQPQMNASCGLDTDGDGSFDTTVDCHRSSVAGLDPHGSVILDGTQLVEGSEVHDALGPYTTMVNGRKTKLPFNREMLGGWAWELNDHTGLEFRYLHRELGRLLEDVQFASLEQSWNLFFGESGFGFPYAHGDPYPGHGAGAFGSYVFANVGENVSEDLFPLPVRDYDALEVIFNRRFHKGWMAYANYRLARLEGNYEGTYRNDVGQADPFLTALFDFPKASALDNDGDGLFDTFLESRAMSGEYTSGPILTERRHIVNAFVSKQFDFGLNLGGSVRIQTGIPRAPMLAHPAYIGPGALPGTEAIYWWAVDIDLGVDDGSGNVTYDGVWDGFAFFTDSDPTRGAPVGDTGTDYDGDGVPDMVIAGPRPDGFRFGPRLQDYRRVDRDFLGRTPTEVSLDLSASYDWALGNRKSQLKLSLAVFNVLGDHDAVGFDNNVESSAGVLNPDFDKANRFQNPRRVRLGIAFSW